jgi:hypothetical protein
MDCFVADMIYVLDFVRESNMDSHPYVEGEGGGRGERERERESLGGRLVLYVCVVKVGAKKKSMDHRWI